MKYPIRIEYVQIERDGGFPVDGVSHVALRLRCKLEGGEKITSMVTYNPEDFPGEFLERYEATLISGMLNAVMLKLAQEQTKHSLAMGKP